MGVERRKVIIDRSMWLHGHGFRGGEETMLLNNFGQKCCLGFDLPVRSFRFMSPAFQAPVLPCHCPRLEYSRLRSSRLQSSVLPFLRESKRWSSTR